MTFLLTLIAVALGVFLGVMFWKVTLILLGIAVVAIVVSLFVVGRNFNEIQEEFDGNEQNRKGRF